MNENVPFEFRSGCPIAATLDLIGDRWSLVIVRDLINGKKRFSEFLASPERITTNILSSRLKTLQQGGLVCKRAYSQKPLRHEYRLTKSGAELHAVLQSICRWGSRNLRDTRDPPAEFMRSLDSQ